MQLFDKLKNGVIAGHSLLGVRSSLEYLAECRSLMHLICEKANGASSENLFGKRRENSLITPMDGRYKSIVDLSRDISLAPSATHPLGDLPKSNAVGRQIVHQEIPMSYLYWEKDDEFINSIEPTEDLRSNVLLYRCVVHTDPMFHEKILDLLNSDLKYCYWLLCQASLYYRGSASITEMYISVLAGRLLDVEFGMDLHAIANDYETFASKYELTFSENKSRPLTLDDLKTIYYKIQVGDTEVEHLLSSAPMSSALLEQIEI